MQKNKNAGLVTSPGKTRLSLADIAQTGGDMRIKDMSPSLWFPAGQPIAPIAPAGTPPRRYAYQPLTNINFSGRDGAVTFDLLRNLSEYPIVRLILETVKDKVCGVKWEYQLKPDRAETKKEYKDRMKTDKRLLQLEDFFSKPDGWQNFRTWSRGLLDDMLVIDAASIWLQKDNKGKICSLKQIDGAEVFPLVDETGEQPSAGATAKAWNVQTMSKKADAQYLDKVKSKGAKLSGDADKGELTVEGGSPAFQLTPYGFPAQQLTADEMIYAVRNRLTYRKYGFSPVEQALAIIALGLGRLEFQSAFYKSGMGFEFIIFAPPDVPISKIEEANNYLDSILAGNARNRRKGFILPSFSTTQTPKLETPKLNEQVLKDEFDEWIARVLCYALGVSPTAFIKQVNRATAEQQAESGEEEGLQPYIDWMQDLLNDIIQNHLGWKDIEAVPQVRKETDALKQAQIDASDFKTGISTYNDIADRRGQDHVAQPWADWHIVQTAQGPVPLEALSGNAGEFTPLPQPEKPGMNEGDGEETPPPSPEKSPKKDKASPPAEDEAKTQKAVKKVDSRSYWPQLQQGNLTYNSTFAKKQMESQLKKCFDNAKAVAIEGVNGLVAAPADKVAKSVNPWSAEYWNKIARQFEDVVEPVSNSLQLATESGISQAAIDLDIPDYLSEVNQQAADWAKSRAAELVGRKWVDGKLVDNPNAKWAITDTTRDDLKRIIAESFEKNTNREDLVADIQKAIEDSNVFSQSRAETIAKTEVGRAQMGASMDFWKASGVISKLKWEAVGSDPCEWCQMNDGAVVPFGESFPSGAKSTLDSHPNCNCIVHAIG